MRIRRQQVYTALVALALSAVACDSPSAPSGGPVGGSFNIGTGFGGPIRFAMFTLNPDIPDPLRVGDSVLIRLTALGSDAMPPGYHVFWSSSQHEVATWVVPPTPCDHNACAILKAVAPTAVDPASKTYTVLLSMQICPTDQEGFCPSRGFDRSIVK
jgi:hypothetical protein